MALCLRCLEVESQRAATTVDGEATSMKVTFMNWTTYFFIRLSMRCSQSGEIVKWRRGDENVLNWIIATRDL